MNAFADVFAKPGAPRLSQLARVLGVTAATVSEWRSGRRPIPIAHMAAIETFTHGAVTRRDLRPDDWQQIWPELAEREGADA